MKFIIILILITIVINLFNYLAKLVGTEKEIYFIKPLVYFLNFIVISLLLFYSFIKLIKYIWYL
jgi:hypothetical protein